MLTNNDIYKKVKLALALKDTNCMQIFKIGGLNATRSFCCAIQKAEDNPDFRRITDHEFTAFLDGLIIYKRDMKF